MGVSGAAKWSGKAKMFVQAASIPVLIFLAVNIVPHHQTNRWASFAWVGCNMIAYVNVIVTVWSGVPYIVGLRRVLVERGRANTAEERSDAPS